MQPFAIVEADVVGNVGHGFFQVGELLEVHHLGLETPEEGLQVRVVPAMALAAHADAQSGFLEGHPIFLAGIF